MSIGIGCYGAELTGTWNVRKIDFGWTDIDLTVWTQDALATHSRDKRLENGKALNHILAACLKTASVYYWAERRCEVYGVLRSCGSERARGGEGLGMNEPRGPEWEVKWRLLPSILEHGFVWESAVLELAAFVDSN